MKIYTGGGDNGRTFLTEGQSVLKTDDRIELIGSLDELSSFVGMAKVLAGEEQRKELTHIQKVLRRLSLGVADPLKKEYRFPDKETEKLERWIDRMTENMNSDADHSDDTGAADDFDQIIAGKKQIDIGISHLYGGCEQASRLQSAMTVARRVERQFRVVAQKFTADRKALMYMNRLSDYFAAAAAEADAENRLDPEQQMRQQIIRDLLKNIDVTA